MAQTPAGLWASRAGRGGLGAGLLEAVPSPGPGAAKTANEPVYG